MVSCVLFESKLERYATNTPIVEFQFSDNSISDINECREGLDTCPSMSSICVNTPGSYRCDCRRGFRFNHTSNSCEGKNLGMQKWLRLRTTSAHYRGG